MTDLRLLALDSEDLEIISAHVQDAVLKVGDMGYSKPDRRFVLLMNRYAWEAGNARGERRRAALHFDFVDNVRSQGIDLAAKEGALELLAVTFKMGQEPAGEVELAFAGGGTVLLDVECLEVRLRDLGGAWAARAHPQHELD